MPYEVDEYGKWEFENGIKYLVEPSQRWIDENQSGGEIEVPPSAFDQLSNHLLEVDFRVVMLEMGM